MERCLVLWFPDWPIVALQRSPESRHPAGAPLAILAQNVVVACSDAARREGVRRGMRRRDAQARCPELRLAAEDPSRDAREFLPVADRIEQLAPGLQLLRPGLCVLRIRGPARYYGGERPAALALVRLLHEEGLEVRAGIADGRFAAEQAARRAEDVLLVPEGDDAAFLAPLPIALIEDERLATLLIGLGIRTLGEFARLGAHDVHHRFGPDGALRHALAAGLDPRRFAAREAAPDHTAEVAFEPPLALADQVAFGVRMTAERFIDALARTGLVCTELRVELDGPAGDGIERVWTHPAAFDAAAVVDRVRWQLEGGLAAAAAAALREGVERVRLTPEAVASRSAHEPGLFGRGADERLVHALSRVQAMLGPAGVVTPSVGGGRRLAERQRLTPWGERPPRPDDRPWPGRLPPPYPASVYPEPIPIEVHDAHGAPVRLAERGTAQGEPTWITIAADGSGTGRDGRAAPGRAERRRITAWAGPWPLVERGWSPTERRRADRFQIVDETGGAWTLLLERDEWSIEGRYD